MSLRSASKDSYPSMLTMQTRELHSFVLHLIALHEAVHELVLAVKSLSTTFCRMVPQGLCISMQSNHLFDNGDCKDS